jgi:hypothetical protein
MKMHGPGNIKKLANILSLSHEILLPALHSSELWLKIMKYTGYEV